MWKFSFKCALIFLTGAAQGFNYCILECGKDKHTVCAYPTNQPGTACGNDASLDGLVQEEKDEILNAHNEYRLQVATGKIFGQPKASNMNKMYWDDELAMIAKRWANQCTLRHDKCRNTKRNRTVGQNIAFEKAPQASHQNVLFQFQQWKDQAKYMKPKLVAKFEKPKSRKEIGHYTQLVWAKSNSVGCGFAEFPYTEDGTTYQGMLMVCNYEPAGNVKERSVYKQGLPCSACESNKCSASYSGLCVSAADTDVGEYNAVSPLFTLGVSILLVATQFFLRWL